VEDAWLQDGLLFRRSLFDPKDPPPGRTVTQARRNWETQIAVLRELTPERDSINYLVSLPPVGRQAFMEAFNRKDTMQNGAYLNQAFSTNQAIDFFLADQDFKAVSQLRAAQLLIQQLVSQYNLIGLAGISLFGLVGLWVLFWASRLLYPLLTIRVALAAAASGKYQPRMLDKLRMRRDPFGELAQVIHQTVETIQDQEWKLQAEAESLRQQVESMRRSGLGFESIIREADDESFAG
jgi:methyl-accepting chemotaxis protein